MNRTRKLALLALSLLAGLYTLAFVVVVAARFAYPFELEWEEGFTLQHVARVAAGEPLYVAPSLAFVPFPYPPLYFHVSSWFGDGFAAPRLVSAAASLATALVCARWVARETESASSGWVAAGLYLATFRASGGWFDVARVDALQLFASFSGAYVLRFARGPAGAVAAGLLFFAGFWTKQTGLPLALGAIAAGAAVHRRRAVLAGAVFAVVAGFAVLAAHLATDGWSSFYWFELLAGHELDGSQVTRFWTRDVLGIGDGASLVPVVALAVGACVLARRAERPASAVALAAVLATYTAVAWTSRLHSGGYDNVLMPMYLALALGGGCAVGRGRATAWPALAALQFGLLMYAPGALVPDRLDREAGEAFVQRLRETPGEVFVPSHPYLAERAGKSGTAHRMGLADVMRCGRGDLALALDEEVTAAILERRFDLIALDVEWPVLTALDEHYRFAGDPGWAEGVFTPRSGVPHRPEFLYVPLR